MTNGSGPRAKVTVVKEAGKQHGTADRKVERGEVGLGEARMPEGIAHGHHDNDEEVAAGVLKGENTYRFATGRLFVDAVDVLGRQFGEFKAVDQPAKGQATGDCGQQEGGTAIPYPANGDGGEENTGQGPDNSGDQGKGVPFCSGFANHMAVSIARFGRRRNGEFCFQERV